MSASARAVGKLASQVASRKGVAAVRSQGARNASSWAHSELHGKRCFDAKLEKLERVAKKHGAKVVDFETVGGVPNDSWLATMSTPRGYPRECAPHD